MTPKNEIVYPDYIPQKSINILFKMGIVLIIAGILLAVDPQLTHLIALARSIVAYFTNLSLYIIYQKMLST